ncbi:coiled-coil domain-containing protein 107-like isoform X3 [Rhinatrema bivittatum]|nr:coiled-coil domain-containing protein 107-like isoform X3 [Rhinatrema bivittatum]
MRNAVEQNIKERSKGHGKGLTFTLMPLYAIGVGVFAAYKFLKIKSKEESSSRMEKNEEDKKAKETENQLLELEQRLAQTETMLNSLLSQLDPLSNCVTVLANNHKDEIMTQLQSIRQLMKESEINKLEQNLEGENGICKEKLEDLIQSLGKHCQVEEVDDNREAVLPETDNEEYCRTADNEHNEHGLHFSHMTDSKYTEIRDRDVQEDASQDVKHSRLRRRNRKD